MNITAEYNDVSEMYNPELWPKEALVWYYHEPRNIVHTAGGIIVSPGVDISPTIQQPLWILSYNCVGLHLRQSAGDKARCTVVDSLLAECDILCLLET